MIRVSKDITAPTSLASNTKYDGEDVKALLLADQHSKCYLCERELVTDFQIEHNKSKSNYPLLRCDWNNLFLACAYCNGKKSNNFDSTIHASTNNIEELLIQKIDFSNKKAIQLATSAITPEIDCTIKLLDRIFNGTKKMRDTKEEKFFEYCFSRILHFQQMVLNFLNDSTAENKTIVEEELSIEKELLGFKYWIIKSNTTLWDNFQDKVVWNKQ